MIRVSVPVHVINADSAPGVKRGGTVNIVTHTIDVIVKTWQFRTTSRSMSPSSRSTVRRLSDIEYPGRREGDVAG